MPPLRRLAAVILVVLMLWPTLVSAQAPKAGVVTTLEGNVIVTRVAQPQPLKFKDDVFVNDKVTTGDKAIARMLLGGKAVVTVRERSSLTITEVPGKSTIDLDAGKIALAVAKDKMKPGELIEIRTPNAVAGVRGTVVVAEVTRATAQVGGAAAALTTSFYILRGFVEAIQINLATGQPFGSPATVGTLQQFRATGISPATLTNIPPGQVGQIVSGLATTIKASPAAAADASAQANENNFGATVSLANTITGQGGGVGEAVVAPSQPQVQTQPATNAPPILPGGQQSLSGISPGTSSTSSSNLLMNGGFETGNFNGWTLSGAGAVISSFGSLMPPEGAYFALLHSKTGTTLPGCATGAACTTSTLSQSFSVPSILSVRGGGWVLSNEYPQFTGSASAFTDRVAVRLVDAAGTTFTLFDRNVNQLHTVFNSSGESNITVAGFTLAGGSGITDLGFVSQTVVASPGTATLSASVSDVSDASRPTALLFDGVVVTADPPLFFVGSGASITRTAPLLSLTGASGAFDSLLVVCCGGSATLGGGLLQASNSTLDFGFSLVSVVQGGRLTSTSGAPLVTLDGGRYTLGANVGVFDLAGVATAVDPATGLTLGTDRPLEHNGVFLDAASASVSTQTVVKVDSALLEATAPILRLTAGSTLTTTSTALDLQYRANVMAVGPLFSLSNSSLTVANGPLVNVAGGSVLRVNGDLVQLLGGSTLNVLNGSLVKVSGGSVLNVSGGLLSFMGAGNTVNITNNLCASFSCVNLAGVTVALGGGATAGNVSLGPSVVKGTGTVNVAPSAAMLLVTGATSKVAAGAN